MRHRPEAILEAAVRVFDRDGVAIPTARIANEAGVSNGTLFHYFTTKQDLIDALYVYLKNDLAAAIGPLERSDSGGPDQGSAVPRDGTAAIRDSMRRIWTGWLTWADNHPGRHRVLGLLSGASLPGPQARAEGEQALTGVHQILVRAQTSGVLIDLPIGYIAATVQNMMDLTVRSDLDAHERDLAFDMAWNALVARHRD